MEVARYEPKMRFAQSAHRNDQYKGFHSLGALAHVLWPRRYDKHVKSTEPLETTIVLVTVPGGGTHDIFGRGCATIKSLYRPFLEFLTKKLDPFRNFCA